MKKVFFVILIICIFTLKIYAQSSNLTSFFDQCIALLGNTVPEGFKRLNRTMYQNDYGIFLLVEDRIVITSGFGRAFNLINEAYRQNSQFYDYLENNNWIFIQKDHEGDIYFKDGVYSLIENPSRRDDGLFSIGVIFTRNLFE